MCANLKIRYSFRRMFFGEYRLPICRFVPSGKTIQQKYKLSVRMPTVMPTGKQLQLFRV